MNMSLNAVFGRHVRIRDRGHRLHVKDMLVVLIDETRAADESMCTYVTNDGVGRLACGSIFGFFSRCQQFEFRHCRQRDRLVEDAPAGITVTQEPSD